MDLKGPPYDKAYSLELSQLGEGALTGQLRGRKGCSWYTAGPLLLPRPFPDKTLSFGAVWSRWFQPGGLSVVSCEGWAPVCAEDEVGSGECLSSCPSSELQSSQLLPARYEEITACLAPPPLNFGFGKEKYSST